MISVLVQLYSNPAALLHLGADRRRARLRAELASLALLLAVGLALIGVAVLTGRPWSLLAAFGLLVVVPLMFVLALEVTTLGHTRLLLFYLYAPPVAAAALLSGLGPIAPIGWVLSWSLGVPLLLGALISSAGAIWVDARLGTIARDRTRDRLSGASAELPALALQRRARLARFIGAIAMSLLVLMVLAALLLAGAVAPLIGLAVVTGLLVFVAACLRLDAWLLCLAGHPLVAQSDADTWHATYAGRWSLFAPARRLLPLLSGGLSLAEAGAPIVALLHEGALGPSLRRACRLLAPAQAELLALSISLQPGGADALRYLEPALPPEVRDIALTYARLAEETGRPRDLRRWLAALTDRPGIVALVSAGFAPDLAQALALASETLQCYSPERLPARATDTLRQAIAGRFPAPAADCPDAGAELVRWPEALLERVEAHERMLRMGRLVDSEWE